MMTETSTKDVNIYTNGGGYGGMGGCGFGGDGYWLIILFLIFAFAGNWGGYGNGACNGGGGGVGDNYVLATDFANIERKLDSVNSGICDSTYALNNAINGGFAAAQNTLTQGFAGVNSGITTQGYETRNAITQGTIANMQGFNSLQAAVQDCCCQTQQNINNAVTQGAFNTNAIQQSLAAQGFANEKATMQNRFDMAQYNCSTITAIDKLGDRIIDYMAAEKAQTLRDENQALRLAASQQAQNNYLINQLRPCPTPAYITCNPWATNGTAYNQCCA